MWNGVLFSSGYLDLFVVLGGSSCWVGLEHVDGVVSGGAWRGVTFEFLEILNWACRFWEYLQNNN